MILTKLVESMTRAIRNTSRPGYLTPPPTSDVLFHHRYWDASEGRVGQLGEAGIASTMVWENPPKIVEHPGGNGPCLALQTLDEPNNGKRGGVAMDLVRYATQGEKVVRWGQAFGYHAHWHQDKCRVIDFFSDSGSDASVRPQGKFRFETYNATDGVVRRWQVFVENGAGGAYVNIPGASVADGLSWGGLTGPNEGKGGYNIVEMDMDLETGRYLSLRINNHVFGRRLPEVKPESEPGTQADWDTKRDALYNLGTFVLGSLSIFDRGRNYCTAIQNRSDGSFGMNDAVSGRYTCRTTYYKGEEYVAVLSYTDAREAWYS